jgi:type IV pilus assembly protein PilC
MVISLESETGGRPATKRAAHPAGFSLASWLPIKTLDRVVLLRQLALMLRSGLTLVQALEISCHHQPKRKLRASLRRVIDSVEQGSSFSEAIAHETSVFPEIVGRLVSAAERTGELEPVLERAADHLDRQARFKIQLLTSITYPALVVVVAIATSLFLIVKVIPRFAVFLERRGGRLPWSTQSLVDLSIWFQSYGPTLALALCSAVLGLVLLRRNAAGRILTDRIVLRLPVVGRLLVESGMASISWTLALLIQSGVTLLDSLRIAAGSLKNRFLSGHFQEAAGQVLEGRALAVALDAPAIPALFRQVIAVGERTGALAEVLGDLGRYYEEQMQAAIRRMSAQIEPVLILVIGGLVGFVYFAFFQAVMSIVAA